jgi:predicted RNase H-like HicB family nuclease
MEILTFLVDQAEEGGYNARAETESIFTQADTLEELNLNISDAIKCHFDDDDERAFALKLLQFINPHYNFPL